MTALAVLAAVALAWHASTAPATDQRPLTMPATFLNLQLTLPNFANDPSWTVDALFVSLR